MDCSYLYTIIRGIPELTNSSYIYFVQPVFDGDSCVYLGTTNILRLEHFAGWRYGVGFDFWCLCNRVFQVLYSPFLRGSMSGNRLGMGTFESSYRIILRRFGELLYLGLGIYFWFYLKRLPALVSVVGLEDYNA